MEYQKQNFQDGEVLTAKRLNHMEDGIADVTRYASNPNLLDNWYFADPINQRGQTEYASAGSSTFYCIDRWRGTKSLSVIIQKGYVTITRKSYSGESLVQILDDKTIPANMSLTGSLLFDDGQLLTVTGLSDGSKGDIASSLVVKNTKIKISINSDESLCFYIIITANNATANIVAAKLELGEQQTLARQENGVWVLNDPPPNKQQELAKCQRYFYRLNPVGTGVPSLGAVTMRTTTLCLPTIWLPVPMRTTPAITMHGIWEILLGAKNYRISEVGLQAFTGGNISFRVVSEQAVDTVGISGFIQGLNNTGADMWLSAEL